MRQDVQMDGADLRCALRDEQTTDALIVLATVDEAHPHESDDECLEIVGRR